MKCRLKVNVTSKVTKTGIIVYPSIEAANIRIKELKKLGIKSIIVDELGGKIK